MTYTPRLLQEYRECETALLEAERLLQEENPNVKGILTLENILSVGTDAMIMIRNHRQYGQRLPVVLEMIAGIRKQASAGLQSEPGTLSADAHEPDVGSGYIAKLEEAKMFEGNWAQCISGIEKDNRLIATAGELAELRMKYGKDSVYCTNGGWVAENFNYLPDGNILVASREYNPLLRHAVKATNKHDAGKEFYLEDKIVAELLKGASQSNVLMLNRKDVPDKIQVDAFGKEPLTAFLGWTQDYGLFLSKNGIKEIKLFVAKKRKNAFSRALWAYYLSYDSALDGINYLDDNYGRAFGVRRSEQPEAASRGERSEQLGTGSTGPR